MGRKLLSRCVIYFHFKRKACHFVPYISMRCSLTVVIMSRSGIIILGAISCYINLFIKVYSMSCKSIEK